MIVPAIQRRSSGDVAPSTSAGTSSHRLDHVDQRAHRPRVEETLIVVSSDLSHYLPYSRARAKDEITVDTILSLKPEVDHGQACGATPINGLLVAARARTLIPELVDLRNSGDTAGDKSRVVGYATLAFHESANR